MSFQPTNAQYNKSADNDGELIVSRDPTAITVGFGNNNNHVAISKAIPDNNFVQIIVRTDHGLSGIRIPNEAWSDLINKFKEEWERG